MQTFRENPDKKAVLLADFCEWSGGFPPDECDDEQRRAYLRYGMRTDLGLTENEAYALLFAD